MVGNLKKHPIHELTNEALLDRLEELLQKENELEVELLEHIAEVDRRKLYRERGFSSMFQYCTQELHVAESVAYKRIRVARAARDYPILLAKIAKRELHLSGACLLASHLTSTNAEELVIKAMHLSKRAIEKLLVERFPQEDTPARVRKLPEPRAPKIQKELSPSLCLSERPVPVPVPGPTPNRPHRSPSKVAPLGMERYRIQFTADADLRAKLEKAQNLLGPSVSRQDLATVFSKALDLLIGDLENKKHGKTSRPRNAKSPTPKGKRASRTIPRAVRREVYDRDGGQCRYVSPGGRRCQERSGLEYHHRVPFGRGGASTTANLELRCKCHNLLAAEQDYGWPQMERHWPGVRESRPEYRIVQAREIDPGSKIGFLKKEPALLCGMGRLSFLPNPSWRASRTAKLALVPASGPD